MSSLNTGTSLEALAGVAAFVILLFAGSRLLPGPEAQGAPLPSGGRLAYRLNGLRVFLLVALVAALGQLLGWWSLSVLYRHFLPIFLAANVFAFVLTGIVFLRGKQPSAQKGQNRLAETLRGLYFGVELNPRLAGVDLKLFSYRPSLIGLGLLNAAFAVAQYEIYGTLSGAMLLYEIFTLLYIGNYFQFEYGMLYTSDIVAERFGGMLIWGDYVLVPFFYSLPGWFLVHQVDPLPASAAVALTALFLFGFWLFRGANEQKHRFKADAGVRIWGRPAETLGGRLLVSGFWGIGRHLNYSGEICIYLAFTLTTGFDSVLPYLLPAWLIALLIHRARRDERRCYAKYGALWTQYTHRARFRMLPFVY
ncbi:MAG: ERG4/ERG24 family protein [Pseudomonadota bacterium]|nr:ERG4/ERG24 family protein [Pseudomonadota bacterium]